jgi:hypothetical protein
MEEHNHEEGQTYIKLDGSMGFKDRSLVTLITKDDVEGEKEETFLFPTLLIDMKNLNAALSVNIVRGYKIVRQTQPTEGQ